MDAQEVSEDRDNRNPHGLISDMEMLSRLLKDLLHHGGTKWLTIYERITWKTSK